MTNYPRLSAKGRVLYQGQDPLVGIVAQDPKSHELFVYTEDGWVPFEGMDEMEQVAWSIVRDPVPWIHATVALLGSTLMILGISGVEYPLWVYVGWSASASAYLVWTRKGILENATCIRDMWRARR